MSLSAGDRLGPYEVIAPLGAGGMGEVYRATDTKLRREVALKLLPDLFAGDPQRLARFTREAQALAALNHPNIAQIYGLEESGGTRALVMELVEGEDLSALIARGPMPLVEVLPIARQIAEALEAAHEQGIIHRDLKPANIKLRPDQTVKVLDFGLAKAIDPATGSGGSSADSMSSPTLTGRATQIGMILGTAAYMSPEQAKGMATDKRVDIWAFGVVAYEMLTGRLLFAGDSVGDTLAAVIRAEIDFDALPAATPPALKRLLRRCLERNRKNRLHDIADARIVIDDVMAGRADERPAVATEAAPAASRHGLLAWLPLIATGLVAGIAGWWLATSLRPAPPRNQPLHANLSLPAGTRLDTTDSSIAISPEGRRIALALTDKDGKLQLWLRTLESSTAQPLAGTEGASYPFWSPDGRSIGFFADQRLKKIDASGSTVQTICEVQSGRGASWGPDGTIVFSPSPLEGLNQVSASGGEPKALTKLEGEGRTHRLPHFLPDGEHVLFLSGDSSLHKDDSIQVLDLKTKKTQLVAKESSEGLYVEPGFLVFVRDATLMAQPFDAGRLKLSGEAVPLAKDVVFNTYRWTGNYAVSSDGLLIYEVGTPPPRRQLTWFDPVGNQLGTVGEPKQFQTVRLTPDGRRLAASIDAERDLSLWIYDLDRSAPTRLTFDRQSAAWPIWSPDGSQMAYSNGLGLVLSMASSGGSPARTIVSTKGHTFWTRDWSPDGSLISLSAQSSRTGWDVHVVSPNGGQPRPVIAGEADEQGGYFSPDGKWMAYLSDESGQDELYIIPFPPSGGKWLVSSGGANLGSRWIEGGRELVYTTREGKLIATELAIQGSSLVVGRSRTLLGGKAVPPGDWDISPDGKRILVAVQIEEQVPPPLTLVQGWNAALKKP
ncbi:MAG TPA: protein kinase [Candidatus Polarisedimenticolia bacterium]|nr:protein kinase [Candidatus Polarisedimenticolia bacterium]